MKNKFPYGTPKNPRRCGIDALMIENPRWSDSMGINPDQRGIFRKHFPWMEFDGQGRCLVRNRAEKKRIMKARGFDERR